MVLSCIILPLLALCMQVAGNPDTSSHFFQSWDMNTEDEDVEVMNLLEDYESATRLHDKGLGFLEHKNFEKIGTILQPCETATIQLPDDKPSKKYKVGDTRSELTITCDLTEAEHSAWNKLMVSDGIEHKKASQDRLQFTSKTGFLKVVIPGPKKKRGNVYCTVSASCLTTCGMVNRAEGEETGVPWQVGLVRAEDISCVFCGGSIISSCYIVTNSMCLQDTSPDEVKVLVGGNHSTAIAINTYVNVESFIIDDNLNVAVLKLSEPLTLNNTVMPICLPDDISLTSAGSNGTVTGWGEITLVGSNADVLMEAQAIVISNEECLEPNIELGNLLTEDMMCTTWSPSNCQDDQGGSLAVEKDGKYVLIGIPTFIGVCAMNDDISDPDIYTRVTSVLDWLKNVTSDCEDSVQLW